MMRYFLNVSAEDATVIDLVGVELPDIEAARRHATSHVTELWEARVLAGKPPLVGWLEVLDDHERGVLRIPLYREEADASVLALSDSADSQLPLKLRREFRRFGEHGMESC